MAGCMNETRRGFREAGRRLKLFFTPDRIKSVKQDGRPAQAEILVGLDPGANC